MDEPMDGFDPQEQIEVKKLIREIGKKQTVMLSTHILAHAQELCDRVIIINQGEIVAEDTPERLSAQIAGSGRIRVTVAGDDSGLLTALKKLSGVTQVKALKGGQFDVETAPGKDLRPEIAKAVVKGDWDLLELHRDKLSLEEIFIKLTKEQ
jgi:ABC-2 type transport system ATP-binding protein